MMDDRTLVRNLMNNPDFKDYIIEDLFRLTDEKKKKLKELIQKIEDNNFETSKKKGTAFEEMVKLLFSTNGNIFEIYHSVKTSSNEIDLVIKILPNGISLKINEILEIEGNSFIIECKNYIEKINVTWVGKFAHLMETHKINYGIIFSANELTGIKKNKLTWREAAGLCKKFYLKNNKLLLNINLSDIKEIANSEKNLYDILEKKKSDIQFDTNLSVHLSEHENSGKMQII